MLRKRLIPCLDVRDGMVVKGVKFADHVVMGDIVALAQRYRDAGADELVFYDIKASTVGATVARSWIERVAAILDIPFCVAGGIHDVASARAVLAAGADKVSVNSKALARPELITELAETFGSQAVVVGVDSRTASDDPGDWQVYQFTGSASTMRGTGRRTLDWVREAEERGAGEIVLNCMDQDGVRTGYDLEQLRAVRAVVRIPLIASGGAGALEHFAAVFRDADVDGALAAGAFHAGTLTVSQVKEYLRSQGIEVRQ
ncbi:MAG: imidazole glycerol phosphate synthase subunit HisF [Deltaproteobacteria bacterium]|nr:imidazole glycerol phosphate synthase subunit HisF [Deltaproteobacteria bacterium]